MQLGYMYAATFTVTLPVQLCSLTHSHIYICVAELHVWVACVRRNVTLKIEEELWRRFRAHAIERGTTASELIESFIKTALGLE
jgi:hypothetical protein